MGKIVINSQKCKACYLCIEACPKKTIEKETNVVFLNKRGVYPAKFIDKNECTGCTICAQICPDLAIEKVYR